MKFDTLGTNENPAILLIHGMFCDANSVMHFAEYLKEEYFIIIPTLNGHYIGSVPYISKENDAKEMLTYLHKEGIEKLALLQGTSMGAEIALEFARISDIPIEHYLFDGGPFFEFPIWFKKIMKRKFQGFANICRANSLEEALRKIMSNRFLQLLVGREKEAYRTMLMDFVRVTSTVTDTTIQNVVDTCYACKLPCFDEEIQKRFIFLFSENEPARKSRKRLMRTYPIAEYKDIPKLKHCGFQVTKPKEYAEYINSCIGGYNV